MNTHHLPAAALVLGTGLACAQFPGPFEGGEAAANLRQAPAADTGQPLLRNAVAAEGRQAGRELDSRDGMQSDALRVYGTIQPGSSRSRAEVRDEARASLRENGTHAYEGGEASAH